MKSAWYTGIFLTALFVLLPAPVAGPNMVFAQDHKARPKTAPAPIGDTRVLAQVGGQSITYGEFKQHLQRINPGPGLDSMPLEQRKKALESLVDMKLFSLAAVKNGLDKDPAVMAEINAATDFIYARELLKRRMKQPPPATEEQIQAYYRNNLASFTRPAQVMARQIVVKTKPEAEAVLKELSQGADFIKLAKEKSIDLSAKSGGLVGWLRKGRLPVEAELAAYELKQGQTSGVVAANNDFRIIRVDQRKESKEMPYKDVKGQIISRLRRETVEKSLADYRNRLKGEYPVKINHELVGAISPR